MEEQTKYEVATAQSFDLAMRRAPELVLEEAKRAAKALQDVISKKARPVRFNGEQYLEFEDWQTVGRFYGITAKVVRTAPVDFGDVRGFEASAVAINTNTGDEISAADSMCLNDEPNWKSKPLFQLRSMAQTRACSKCLRNVLAWVVVLAGYRPTPEEEMDGVFQQRTPPQGKPTVTPPQRKSQLQDPQPPPAECGPRIITEPQRKRFYALAKGAGRTDQEIKSLVYTMTGQEHSSKIPAQIYDEICAMAQKKTAEKPAEQPHGQGEDPFPGMDDAQV